MNKILFIKSDLAPDKTLLKGLSPDFKIETIARNNSFLTKFKKPNLVLIDSPVNQNLAMFRKLRQDGVHVPIIAFSKSDPAISKANALMEGADDVVDEDIEPQVFKAKLHSLLRRPLNYFDHTLQHNKLKLNFIQRTLEYGDKKFLLRRREFDLLVYFLKNKDRVVSKDEIQENVWESEELLSTNTVEVHITYLRRKLGNLIKIENVYGIGYRLSS